ncbi:MAG: ferredoxin [Deltaproteobacteria bacterium]|nr:ferredoxin [Deltaproteobacteria bacterium]
MSANRMQKIMENVPGKYYVDESCIGCSICVELAPDNLRSNLEEGYEYVFKQPATESEENRCIEAMEICPVSAIGDDGIE